jgi:[calcium/calmodulin-dependent protein kinase] kinase
MKAISKFKGLQQPQNDGIANKGSRKDIKRKETKPTMDATGGTDQASVIAGEEDSAASYAARLVAERQRFERMMQATPTHESMGDKGQGQDPTETKPLLLGIGTGGQDDFSASMHAESSGVVSDSPTAVDFNVYDRAFEAEVEKIKRSSSRRGTGSMYLTKHLDEKEKYRADKDVPWVRSPPRTPVGTSQSLAEAVVQVVKGVKGKAAE